MQRHTQTRMPSHHPVQTLQIAQVLLLQQLDSTNAKASNRQNWSNAVPAACLNTHNRTAAISTTACQHRCQDKVKEDNTHAQTYLHTSDHSLASGATSAHARSHIFHLCTCVHISHREIFFQRPNSNPTHPVPVIWRLHNSCALRIRTYVHVCTHTFAYKVPFEVRCIPAFLARMQQLSG